MFGFSYCCIGGVVGSMWAFNIFKYFYKDIKSHPPDFGAVAEETLIKIGRRTGEGGCPRIGRSDNGRDRARKEMRE